MIVERYGNLDEVYRTMLSHHIDLADSATASFIRLVLEVEQTTNLKIPLHQIMRIFSPLHDRLEPAKPVVFHPVRRLVRLLGGGHQTGVQAPALQDTFRTFLSRSFPPRVLEPQEHEAMAVQCMRIMAKELCFNICQLPSSFIRNSDVKHLTDLVDANVSDHLRYASLFWSRHLARLEQPSAELVQMITDFFHTRFLHWLEVMSITSNSASDCLRELEAANVRIYIAVNSVLMTDIVELDFAQF